MDIDQDVLFWNAHAFLNSQLLSAKKIWVTLTAVEESVRRGVEKEESGAIESRELQKVIKSRLLSSN